MQIFAQIIDMTDVLGDALSAYFHKTSTGKLWVNNKYGPREEMPVDVYFREAEDMPELEWLALQQCQGRVLDIGAGAGSHALILQQMGLDITALDISPKAAAVMHQRGVKQVLCQDFFSLAPISPDTGLKDVASSGATSSDPLPEIAASSDATSKTAPSSDTSPKISGSTNLGFQDSLPQTTASSPNESQHLLPFDTLLLLMNGIGLAGTLDGLRNFLAKARTLLRPGGRLIFDSSDIAYMYDGKLPKTGDYYGEILYQYEYRKQQSDWFKWLFIDRKTLSAIALSEGWQTEVLFGDEWDQYLVKCHLL